MGERRRRGLGRADEDTPLNPELRIKVAAALRKSREADAMGELRNACWGLRNTRVGTDFWEHHCWLVSVEFERLVSAGFQPDQLIGQLCRYLHRVYPTR